MASSSQLIEELYDAFKECERPQHFTNYKHCWECFEHDQTMQNAALRTLSAKSMGTSGWGPLSFLTEQGFAHYMPRLIELALANETTEYDDPFVDLLVFQLSPDNGFDRFATYNLRQSTAILNSLRYMLPGEILDVEDEILSEDITQAISYWEKRVNGAAQRSV